MNPKRERVEGGVLFQDGEDPQPGALEITDDDGKGSEGGRRRPDCDECWITNFVSDRTDERQVRL